MWYDYRYWSKLLLSFIYTPAHDLEVKVMDLEPTSVAQLDAHPTGDQEVAGSSPAGSATFIRGD